MIRAAVVRLDTADLPAGERMDAWRSSMVDQFLPMLVEPGRAPLRARVTGHNLAQTRLRTIESSAHTYARRPCDIAAGDPDVLHLLLVQRGRLDVEQDGRVAAATRGDMLFYDGSRPFTFVHDDTSRSVVCLLPRRLLPVTGAAQRARVVRPVASDTGVASAAAALLASLARTPDVDQHQEQALQQTLVSMYVAMLLEGTSACAPPPSVHVGTATAFIARHLGDAELDPGQVAAACHVSLSYLHRIFAAEGLAIAGYIREQRLLGAHRDLSRSRPGTTVDSVARAWGVPDPSQFSRMFKRRFGQTPSDVLHSHAR